MLITSVDRYLSIRRLVGFQLKAVEFYLRDFAGFASARGETHVVSKTAIDWASKGTSEAQRHNRLSIVIRFAYFVRAEDPRHQIPPEYLFCNQRQRPTPYIFSDQEIQHLIASAQKLGPSGTLRPYTYSILFGLLATTGMRVSEARSLKINDVTVDGLVIRESKFKKSRLIPLHETTWLALNDYLTRRFQVSCHDPHLFLSRRGGKLSHTIVSETFRKVMQSAGIHGKPGHRQPRLMDLRHSFAVKSLLMCTGTRDHISRHILALSTYMGHAKVHSTFWYLESTLELMVDIAHKCEMFIYGGAS